MAATWQSNIAKHGDVADKVVDILATRTDGSDPPVTVRMTGLRVENVSAALRDRVAAELKARAMKRIADDAAEETLTSWAVQLDTALNALET